MKKLISDLVIEKHKITAFPSADLSDYLNEPLFIESEDVDFSNVPADIACLPFVYNLAPVVWRLGGQWSEEKLSQQASENLQLARQGMQNLWREYQWMGSIQGQNKASRPTGKHPALLFSGGLDSTFSAMQLIDKKPVLVTIHGGRDLQLQDESAWQAVETATEKFASAHSLEKIQIRSNFTKALTENAYELCPNLPASWWASIQHGMGLAGVAAPAIYSAGCSELFISATHTTGHQAGWGSHPTLDGVLDWSAAKANHFGYDHDRTEKILALKTLAEQKQVEIPELIVCTRRNRSGNCMRCPKCLRTMGSVLANNLEPKLFGFEISKSEAEAHLREYVPGKIKVTDNEVFAWGSISKHAQAAMENNPSSFVKWLAKLDLRKKPSLFQRLIGRK